MSKSEVEIEGSRVLVVDDTPANLELMCRALSGAGYEAMVAPSGELALQLAQRFVPDLVLLDVTMPGLDGFAVCRRLKEHAATRAIPVLFLTARNETADLLEGFRAGGVDYVTKPFQKEEVLARIHTHLEKAALLRALKAKNEALEAEMAQRQRLTSERDALAGRLSLAAQREAQHWALGSLVGQSPTLRQMLDNIGLLQDAPNTAVLIEGESGTGKELVARAIHAGSSRASGPFVAVNCAAIPRELADSLLFGHVKGSFTGAERDQAGYFELAQGGTLFLDEVGTMPLELQPKLLRVLEERRVLPLGARQPRSLELRVLSATNSVLPAQIQAGTFRQDLYYRLAPFTVRVPALRDRREDIGLLARHFLQVFALEMGIQDPVLDPAAVALLEGYPFPGNVRELKNIVERALIESRQGRVHPEHLHLPAAEGAPAVPPVAGPAPLPGDLDLAVAQYEVGLVRRALAQTSENVAAAARLLGTNRTRIYRILGTPPESL
ncbi:MAG: sigma-54-dependent Fis family transcriptional regulator [Candidatus Latescibacteria bacterium]|nr:sigma-54-dependent Fis family transcriptional regulator [Candidatus Latescibacterota bacterium]